MIHPVIPPEAILFRSSWLRWKMVDISVIMELVYRTIIDIRSK